MQTVNHYQQGVITVYYKTVDFHHEYIITEMTPLHLLLLESIIYDDYIHHSMKSVMVSHDYVHYCRNPSWYTIIIVVAAIDYIIHNVG